MRLRYIGPKPGRVGVVPLPEGWPAQEHDEPDEAVADAKCRSGMYARVSGRRRAKDENAPDDEKAPDETRKEVS